LLFIIVCAAIYLLLLFLIETNVIAFFRKLFDQLMNKHYYSKRAISSSSQLVAIDNDVELEKKRIHEMNPENKGAQNPLVVRDLTKRFGNFTAVKSISYGIHQGECFGMLGVNGAGKTTTFRMITGDESVTLGEVYVNGLSLATDLRRIQQQMGYCPQFDATLEDLTGRETLALYARLRGIKEEEMGDEIRDLAQLLYFDMHLDKLVGKYSGGNRRKLSTAIVSIIEC